MAQSDKKTINLDFGYIGIIFVFLVALGILGYRNNTVSKKEKAAIEQNVILSLELVEKDSIIRVLNLQNEELKGKVETSDQTVATLTINLNKSKEAYKELASIPPSPCDTFIKLVECDEMLVVYDNYIDALKLNVISRQNLIDTLQIENKALQEYSATALKLSQSQQERIARVEKSLRRSKVANYVLGGVAASLVVVIATL